MEKEDAWKWFHIGFEKRSHHSISRNSFEESWKNENSAGVVNLSNVFMRFADLSETQQKMLKLLFVHYEKHGTEKQIAGYGNAKWLSAGRALTRKGLAGSWRTGYYHITEAGRVLFGKNA
jgi:hypothetical protein